MKQYAGIDVSLEASHVCVVDAGRHTAHRLHYAFKTAAGRPFGRQWRPSRLARRGARAGIGGRHLQRFARDLHHSPPNRRLDGRAGSPLFGPHQRTGHPIGLHHAAAFLANAMRLAQANYANQGVNGIYKLAVRTGTSPSKMEAWPRFELGYTDLQSAA